MAIPGSVVNVGKLVTPGGALGPQGNTGPTGSQGPAGPQGPTGSPGAPGAIPPLADNTQNGLLRQNTGKTTDFVDGTNNCQPIIPQITSVRLRSLNAVGNQNFEVDQKQAGVSVYNGAIDRWAINKTGTMVPAIQQIVPGVLPLVPGTNFVISRSALLIQLSTAQATLGAGDYLFLNQFVEGPMFRELSQDVHSFSLLVYSTVANLKFSVSLSDPARTKSLVMLCTVPTASVWTYITLPNLPIWASGGGFSMVPGNVGYNLTICLASGSNFLASPGTWQNGNFIGATGMSNFAASPVNSQFILGFVQHEPGPVCTTLQDKPFTQNLDECMRYFQTSVDYGQLSTTPNTPSYLYGIVSSSNLTWVVGLPGFQKPLARMPTVLIYNQSTGAVNSVSNISQGLSIDLAGSAFGTTKGIPGLPIVSGSQTGGNLICFNYTADTGW